MGEELTRSEIESITFKAVLKAATLLNLSGQQSATSNEADLLSVKQLSELTGVPEKSIYSRIRNKSISFQRKAGRVFFTHDVISLLSRARKQLSVPKKEEASHA